jgi:hypothetical protein
MKSAEVKQGGYMLFAQAEPTITTLETTTVTTVDETSLAIFSGVWLFVWLVLLVLLIVAHWKVFEKAGEAGWKSLIPFYNAYTLFRIAGRNGWWFLGLLVPLVNIVVLIMLSLDLAKHFGKSSVFGIVGLFFFSVIGYLMLGFGDAKYVGTKHE